MGYVARVGDFVKSKDHLYKIIREINKGGFADAYKARREDGEMVFLKQYKSPSKLVPWFDDYFKYEAELNRRLREDPVLKTASIYANEMFLGRCYKPDGSPWTRNECIFQVFPFITGNTHLGDMIEKGTKMFNWEKRVYACAVFAFALRKLHDADVVHCDLKPENVQVKLDNSIAIKYRPLLIDMDWSILSDIRAPWHGKQGYVGTPGYTSPEHLKDLAPLEASDVFTASIIMCQVLAGRHPFQSALDSDDLNKYILSGKNDFSGPDAIPFAGEVTPAFRELLFKALSVDPKERPTMEQIHLELMGMCKELGKPKKGGFASLPKPSATASGAAPKPLLKPRAKAPSRAASSARKPVSYSRKTKLVLIGDLGTFSTKSNFVLDQSTLRRVSSDAKFADPNDQFEIVTARGNRWKLIPNINASNFTVLDGASLESAGSVDLDDGAKICLRGKASGKTAMPLSVKIEEFNDSDDED